MSDATTALHAALAQRLFGWHWEPKRGWHHAEGQWCRVVPPYSTDPAATALVWQWLEGLQRVREVSFCYDRTRKGDLTCDLVYGGTKKTDALACAKGAGATWPDALCRAALALAEALEGKA